MKYHGEKSEIIDLVKNYSSQESLKSVVVIDEIGGTLKLEAESKCLLLTDQIPPQQILNTISSNKIRHLIQFSNSDYKQNFKNAILLIEDRDLIFSNPSSLFLSKNEIQEFRFSISQQPDKLEISNSIRNVLNNIPKSSSVRDSALIVAHELLINVIYDAPKYYFEKYGKPRIFKNENDQLGEIILSHDNKKMLVGAIDNYGSLDLNKLINRLKETFIEDKVSPNLDPQGGAGIGCRMMFELTTEMVFSVLDGEKTFVGGCFPLGQSLRKQSGTPKNIHLMNNGSERS